MEHILLVREWNLAPHYVGLELLERWESPDAPNSNAFRDYCYEARKRNGRERRLNGIKISSQAQLLTPVEERKLYGFRVTLQTGVDLNWHNLEDAENDIARMKKILKEYQRLVEKFGEPKGFVQFSMYIANVIDAKLAQYVNGYVQDMSMYNLEALEYKVLGKGV